VELDMSTLSRSSDQEGRQATRPARALSRTDTVPLLRSDLVVARGGAPGQFEVWDPRGGGALVLLDVELSVARMFDGSRRVTEVLENADQLGIPADLEGLARFIQGLERQRFLAPAGARPVRSSRSRPRRASWDPGTRERFRSAMKLVRTGRPDEAVPAFQLILASHPEVVEAQEMLSLIAAGHALVASPIGELFSIRYRPGRGSGWNRTGLVALAATALLLAALVAWAFPSSIPSAAPSLATSAPVGPGRGATPIERRWHPAIGELRAPAAGVLAWRDPIPARVAIGERLGEIRASSGTRDPGPTERGRIEELQRLAATDPVYLEFLERERTAQARPANPDGHVGLTSPYTGTLTRVAPGQALVTPGELLARLVDGEAWRLSATLGGRPPESGEACEVAGDGPGDRASGRVVATVTRDGQHQVTCAVTAAQAPWIELARAPTLRLP
jgi:hypothetical protein